MRWPPGGRGARRKSSGTQPAGVGQEEMHGEGAGQQLQAGLSDSPATAAVARQGYCCCRRAAQPLHSTCTAPPGGEGGARTACRAGQTKSGSGTAAAEARTTRARRLATGACWTRRADSTGALSTRAAMTSRFSKAAAVSTVPGTQGSRRTALCRSSAACLWPRHPPPAAQGTHGRRGRANQDAAASQALV